MRVATDLQEITAESVCWVLVNTQHIVCRNIVLPADQSTDNITSIPIPKFHSRRKHESGRSQQKAQSFDVGVVAKLN